MVDMIAQNSAYYVRQAHFDSDRMAGTIPHWKNNSPKNDVSIASQTLNFAQDATFQPSTKAPSASFDEFLDVVNPLHHLPVVGSMYRHVTGDEISAVARFAGGTLYGGALGGLSSLAQSAIEEHAGKDVLSAVKDGANSKKSYYTLEEEPRMAGLKKSKPQPDDEKTVDIAMATATVIPSSKPVIEATPSSTPSASVEKTYNKSESIDLWKALEAEEREPVTAVSIDLAKAEVIKSKPQWNFNT